MNRLYRKNASGALVEIPEEDFAYQLLDMVIRNHSIAEMFRDIAVFLHVAVDSPTLKSVFLSNLNIVDGNNHNLFQIAFLNNNCAAFDALSVIARESRGGGSYISTEFFEKLTDGMDGDAIVAFIHQASKNGSFGSLRLVVKEASSCTQLALLCADELCKASEFEPVIGNIRILYDSMRHRGEIVPSSISETVEAYIGLTADASGHPAVTASGAPVDTHHLGGCPPNCDACWEASMGF